MLVVFVLRFLCLWSLAMFLQRKMYVFDRWPYWKGLECHLDLTGRKQLLGFEAQANGNNPVVTERRWTSFQKRAWLTGRLRCQTKRPPWPAVAVLSTRSTRFWRGTSSRHPVRVSRPTLAITCANRRFDGDVELLDANEVMLIWVEDLFEKIISSARTQVEAWTRGMKTLSCDNLNYISLWGLLALLTASKEED